MTSFRRRCWPLAVVPLAAAGLVASSFLLAPAASAQTADRIPITALAYDRDGSTLASGDARGIVTLWDRAGKAPPVTLPGANGTVRALAFDELSGLLAAAGQDRQVHIFDLTSKKQAAAWFGETPALAAVPAGGLLILDNKQVLWVDTPSRDIRRLASTDEYRVGANLPALTALAESPTGSFVATAGADGTLSVRDFKYLEIHARPRTDGKPIGALVFTANERFLGSIGADSITVWNLRPFPDDPIAVDSWQPSRTISLAGMRAALPAPGGSLVAAAGSDGGLHLVDFEDGSIRQLDGASSAALSLAVSPSGDRVAAGYEDGSIVEWDLRSGQMSRISGGNAATSLAPRLETDLGNPSRIIAVTVNAKAGWSASASEDGSIILWDSKTYRRLRQLPAQWRQVRDIAAHPTANELAIVAEDANEKQALFVWNVDTWKQSESRPLILPKPRTATGLDNASIVASVALSPDWTSVAYGFMNGEVEIVPQTPGAASWRFPTSPNMAIRLSFSPDGKHLATWTNLSSEVLFWNIGGRAKEGSFDVGPNTNVLSLALSGSQVAAWTAAGARVWNIGATSGPDLTAAVAQAWRTRQIFECRGMAFDAAGSTLIAGASDGSLQRFQIQPAAAWIAPAATVDRISGVAFDATDAALRVTSIQNYNDAYWAEQSWDTRAGSHIESRQAQIGVSMGIAGSGVWTAGTAYNGLVFRQPASGAQVLVPGIDQVSSVRISPRGTWAAVTRYDGTIQIVSRATQKVTASIASSTFAGHPTAVQQFFNAAENAFVISDASREHDTGVFDPASGDRIGTLPANAGTPMEVAPDRTFVVTSRFSTTGERNRIELHDLAKGALLRELDRDNDNPGAVSFSSDGKLMAGRFHGNIVRVWNLETDKVVADFEGHSGGISATAFAPSGDILLSASSDGTARLWRIGDLSHIATLISLNRGKDWAVLTPDGRFDGTPAAWKEIQWRFSDKLRDVASAEAFFADFFTPGLLGDVMQERPAPARRIQDIDRRSPSVRIASRGRNADHVTLSLVSSESPADASHKQGSGVRDLRLFRNGLLVGFWPGEIRTTETIDVPLAAGPNRFKAYAFNRDNVKSEDSPELAIDGPATPSSKPKLYVVGIGIDRYSNADFNLQYAVADAKSVVEEISALQKKLDRFETVPILLEDATRDDIRAKIQELSKEVRPDDAVVLFFAGHGIAWNDGFYMLPRDLDFDGPRSAVNAAALAKLAGQGISDKDLDALLRGLNAASIALIIDSCNSGQALEAAEKRRGPLNTTGLAQLAWEKGIFILTAAQSFEEAHEDTRCGHGLLTCALVEYGLVKGEADRAPKDGKVTLPEWLDFAADRVPELQTDAGSRGVGITRSARQRPRAYLPDVSDQEPLTIAAYAK